MFLGFADNIDVVGIVRMAVEEAFEDLERKTVKTEEHVYRYR